MVVPERSMMEHLVKVDATIGRIKGSNGLLVGGIHVTGSNGEGKL